MTRVDGLQLAERHAAGHRRTTNIAWLQSLRDQCSVGGAAFLLKQAVIMDSNVLVTIGSGSTTKFGGQIVELPYLDGIQHAAFPKPETSGR